jgi:multisubunit Na+/H+ antiporter MnhG subunit
MSARLDPASPVLRIVDVYRDAWRIYRLLFRRSVLAGAIVFGVVALVDVAHDHTPGLGAAIGFGILGFVLDFGAPVFVQGALIEIVRNVHEGRAAKPIGALYAKARKRFRPLFWASIFYSLGVLFGLLLLVVPGLLAAARWSLMAPFVVLEDDDPGDALDKSRATVSGRTGRVMSIVVATFVLFSGASGLIIYFLPGGAASAILFAFVWSSLTAPFEAHVLSVVYYRLTDPVRPVIHEDVPRWRSVWAGA